MHPEYTIHTSLDNTQYACHYIQRTQHTITHTDIYTQIEGASNEGGRGPSIWDTFTKAGRSYKNQTGDVAVDFYNRYQEDINMMKAMGIRNFRLSISWCVVVYVCVCGVV